jgi:membrane-associated protein
LEAFLSQVLDITGTFNFKIAIILYLLCAIGEVGFTLPYILETVWLLAGYHLAKGDINGLELLYMWLIAQAGRQTGSAALYYSSLLGMIPLKKFWAKHIQPRLPKKQFMPPGLMKTLSNPTPFSIALARLVGLRIPMAVTMSIKQKLSSLVLGVLLSSIIWDGIYLILGSTVGTKVPNPTHMFLYSLGGLTGLYLVTLGVRYLVRSRSDKSKSASKSTEQ